MTNNKPTLQECAMQYGTLMGIYWAIKFIFFPSGFGMPVLLLLFAVLTLGVPFIGYSFAKKYRERYCEGNIGFAQSFLFTMFMYSFASLFVAVVHYIYFRYIDNGFILTTYQEMLNEVKANTTDELSASLEQLQQALDQITQLTPLEITFQLITQNIFYCMLIAIPTALLVMRKKKNQ